MISSSFYRKKYGLVREPDEREPEQPAVENVERIGPQ
jgi:hypothetical protein